MLLEQAPATTATFPPDAFAQMLKQVARLVGLRATLESERDVALVELGGFDTHSTCGSDDCTVFSSRMQQINGGMEAFKEEMVALGMWDSVTLVAISDFGRTITSNGLGTDVSMPISQV